MQLHSLLFAVLSDQEQHSGAMFGITDWQKQGPRFKSTSWLLTSLLCEVCMFPLCPYGCSPGILASSHSAKTSVFHSRSVRCVPWCTMPLAQWKLGKHLRKWLESTWYHNNKSWPSREQIKTTWKGGAVVVLDTNWLADTQQLSRLKHLK